jgi:hypothetical protein
MKMDSPSQHATLESLSGGREMGQRIRSFDWTNTFFGQPMPRALIEVDNISRR